MTWSDALVSYTRHNKMPRPPVQVVGRWRPLGNTLSHDPSKCRWLQEAQETCDDCLFAASGWRSDVLLVTSTSRALPAHSLLSLRPAADELG